MAVEREDQIDLTDLIILPMVVQGEAQVVLMVLGVEVVIDPVVMVERNQLADHLRMHQ